MARKILLVDDEPLILKGGLKYSLEQDGYLTDSRWTARKRWPSFCR